MENPQENKDVLDIKAQLRAELEAAKETITPPTGFVISTKGKQFSLPDGSVSNGPMNATILDYTTANMYYSGAYDPKKPAGPVCWAIGKVLHSLAPSDNAPNKQNDTCNGCGMNEFGSAPGGGKGKACKNTRRLLVVGEMTEDAQPYSLTVSPTGLRHFDKYISSLTDRGILPIEVVTEISFDPNEAYPSLRFKALDKHDNVELAMQLREGGKSILNTEPQPDNA